MNVFAKFDEIPSMVLQDIKETKRYGHTHTHTHTVGRTDGQRENSIPAHKHSLRGGGGGGIKILQEKHQCQIVWTKIRPGESSGLICVQTVCIYVIRLISADDTARQNESVKEADNKII